jgi:hypothetical protein
MTELSAISENTDVPADRYCWRKRSRVGQYKRLRNEFTGVLR